MPSDLTTHLPTAEIPVELVEAGASGHLVIFVGAGASRAANFPSWEGMLDILFSQAKAEASSEQLMALLEYEEAYEPRTADGNRKPPPNLLVKASLIAQTMGDAFWRAKVVDLFDRPAPTTAVHQALAALPGAWFITTNYDRLMEQAIAETSARPPRVVLATALEDLGSMDAGDVLKVHGDLSGPETLVLTREDYLEMSQGTANAWKERLKSWLQPPFQMLFVGYGYGYDDIDLQSVIQNLRFAYGKKLPGPFWLEKNSPLARTKAKAEGLRLVPLHNYDAVPFLESLKGAINSKKLSAPIFHRVRLIEDIVFDALPKQFEERAKQARKLYEDYHYDEAILAYKELLNDVQQCLIAPASTAEQLRIGRQWIARCRMSLGCCYLSIGQYEPAKELIHAVRRDYEQEPDLLRLTSRASLADGLAALGEQDAARSILPTSREVMEADLDEQARANIETVRQQLEIERGNIPNGLSPWLGALAVRELVKQTNFEKAEQVAATVLLTEGIDWPTKYNASLALVQALLSTVWENPTSQKPIPVNRRKLAVKLLERELQKLIEASMPKQLNLSALHLAARFYHVTDHPSLEAISHQLVTLGSTVLDTDQQRLTTQTFELARQGKLEEALALLPAAGAPWVYKYEQARLLFQLNRANEARDLLQRISAEYPKRPIVDYQLAALLHNTGEHGRALCYARAAFIRLPGWGQRQLLAECLLVSGQPWKAYVLLSALDQEALTHSSTNIGMGEAQKVAVLHIQAQAAARHSVLIKYAPELYRRYLQIRPGDHRTRIHRARLLWGLSEGQEAAEEAWRAACNATAGDLVPYHLYDCALMQSVGDLDSGEYRDRVQQIARWLSERYKGSVEAEQYRFYLLSRLGMLADRDEREPFDISLLLKSGTLVPVEQEKVIQLIKTGNEIYPYLHAQYLNGYIILESLCYQLDEQTAWLFTQTLSSKPRRYFCAPHSLIAVSRITSLAGSHLLCSAIELLLLQYLGLLHALKQALQPGGKLLLFSDVWERVVHDAGLLKEGSSIDPSRAAPESIMAAKQALDLHRYIGTGIQEGWIDIHLHRPASSHLLPPLRNDGSGPSQQHIWREDRCRALSYRQALINNPHLRLLSAEFGVVELFPDPIAPLRYNWSADQYLAFTKEFRAVEERMIHLPSLVASLPPPARAHEKLCQLADLGFQEALNSLELLRLAKRFSGLSRNAASSLLDRAEWQAREPEHLGFTTARLCLAVTYAKTCWAAFASVQRDPQDAMRSWSYQPDLQAVFQLGLQSSPSEAESVTSTLIARIESLRAIRSDGILDTFLEQIASTVVSDVGPSGRLEGDIVVVSLDTPAGGLWRYLARWAGAQGPRRNALVRAIRFVWLLLDGEQADEETQQGEGQLIFREPTSPQAAVLQMGQTALDLAPQAFMAAEQETVAILSAHWSIKPLTSAGGHITVKSDVSKDYFYEEVLSSAAKELELQDTTNNASLPLDEHFFLYQFKFDDGTNLPVLLPVEAILLRSSEKVIKRLAPVLAQRQGIHDGRLYEQLFQISEAPQRIDIRRLYARTAVAAPWRQIREEPSVLATWAYRKRYRQFAFPRSIADLRAILSEEPLQLSSDEPPALLEILKQRIEQGIWRERSDSTQLYLQACEIPGWLLGGTIPLRLKDRNLAHEVSAALDRLIQPHNQTATRLAGDILFLRAAASRKPVVRVPSGVIDLRERLAERLAVVLRAVADPPPEGTLAFAEAPILRLCGKVVEELALPERLPMAECLWLTYRLYRWLVAQLATLTSDRWQQALADLHQLSPSVLPPPSSDVLNPFYFQQGRVDHRLMAVLFALSAGEQISAAQQRMQTKQEEDNNSQPIAESSAFTVSSAELESVLIELASRPLTPDEESLRDLKERPSALEWYHASTVPELSLDTLLRLDEANILKLSSSVRLRWIQQIPLDEENKSSITDNLATMLLLSFSEHIESLTPIELVALEDRLRRAPSRNKVPVWRWLIYTALFEAGKTYLREEVQELLIQHLGERAAPSMFGRYLMTVGKEDVAEMRKVAIDILKTAEQKGFDAPLLAWGIGRVVFKGSQALKGEATTVVKELADRPPYRDSPSMLQLLQWLNISGASK